MEESLIEVIPRLEKRTHYLATLANIGMLMGLLGTVIGLIHAFAAVASVNPAEKASMLSASISVAMNNTALGLGARDHAAALPHVPRDQDDRTRRQPRSGVDQVPEHGGRASRPGAATGRTGDAAAVPRTACREAREAARA